MGGVVYSYEIQPHPFTCSLMASLMVEMVSFETFPAMDVPARIVRVIRTTINFVMFCGFIG